MMIQVVDWCVGGCLVCVQVDYEYWVQVDCCFGCGQMDYDCCGVGCEIG